MRRPIIYRSPQKNFLGGYCCSVLSERDYSSFICIRWIATASEATFAVQAGQDSKPSFRNVRRERWMIPFSSRRVSNGVALMTYFGWLSRIFSNGPNSLSRADDGNNIAFSYPRFHNISVISPCNYFHNMMSSSCKDSKNFVLGR